MSMQNRNLDKKIFMEKWLKGLQTYNNSSKKEMTILERTKLIKITSDIAMASTRTCSTFWSQALLANASQDHSNNTIINHMLCSNSKIIDNASKTVSKMATNSKKIRSKKIVKRSRMAKRVNTNESHVIAKRLVKKRTKVLKNLVPGGQYLKNDCLVREALDYIDSLCVQVDVMRSLAYASEHFHFQQV